MSHDCWISTTKECHQTLSRVVGRVWDRDYSLPECVQNQRAAVMWYCQILRNMSLARSQLLQRMKYAILSKCVLTRMQTERNSWSGCSTRLLPAKSKASTGTAAGSIVVLLVVSNWPFQATSLCFATSSLRVFSFLFSVSGCWAFPQP